MTSTGQPEVSFADAARRYRLDELLATGGMGEVWRGYDTALDRPVAVKILKPEWADDLTYRRRFAYEARHAAALRHPDIAAIYDVGETTPRRPAEPPRPFLVMEYIDGRPLSQLLGRPLDPAVVASLLATAADALGAAHAAGIIHRDVKPANLMVTTDRRLKVTDFGIARATDGVALTTAGEVLGTPSYLSPEQARGDRATSASDVYSLGVVAYEALAGVRPFVRSSAVATAVAHVQDTPAPLPARLPAALVRVVERAMAKDPAQRYPDGTALAAALRAASGQTGRGTPPVGVTPADTHADAMTQILAPPPDDGGRIEHTRMLSPAPATPTEPAQPVPPAGSPPQQGSWVWPVLAVLVVVALIAGGALFLTRDRSKPTAPAETPTSQAPTTPASSGPETVEIDEGDYLGRPFDDVAADLEALGLTVTGSEITQRADQQENPGDVVSVSPSGTLTVGENVTVEYWGPQPTPSATPTPTETPSPSPTETPATSAPATPQESATP